MIGAIAGALINGLLGKAFDAFKLWQEKKITEAEMDAMLKQAVAEAMAEIETAWAKAAAEIYASAQATIQASFSAPGWWTRNAWAFVVVSQTFVLLWYQLGLPLVATASGWTILRTGDGLLQWAYLLIGGALGIGAIQVSGVRGQVSKTLEKLTGK